MTSKRIVVASAVLSLALFGGALSARQFNAGRGAQPGAGIASEIVDVKSEVFKGLSAEDECCRSVTQGEFALMLAHGLGLAEPQAGWTESKAAAELARMGRSPRSGWEIQKSLDETVLRQLLAGTRFEFSQAAILSQPTVPISRARAVFREGLPVTQGRFAVMLVQAGGGSRSNAPSLTVDQALVGLTAKGIKPEGGWRSDALLTEKVMRELLERTGLNGPLPDGALVEIAGMPVDLSRAYGVVFEKTNVITQGMVALLLVKRSGLPAPADGWTVEAAIAELEKFNSRPEYGWVPTAPICQSDMARLARRAGLIIAATDNCQVVVGESKSSPIGRGAGEPSFSGIGLGASLIETPRIGPIFGPARSTPVSGTRPSNTGTGGQPTPVPVPVPVPPIIIGPELPSNATSTPPRERY